MDYEAIGRAYVEELKLKEEYMRAKFTLEVAKRNFREAQEATHKTVYPETENENTVS